MPVGTHGAIKALPPSELVDMDAKIILSNTYHLHLTPGSDLIKKAGGLHKFMNWDGRYLLIPAVFKYFLFSKKASKKKAPCLRGFKGKDILLSPETSIEIQQNLGSDIMMAFDECIPYPATREYTKKSMDRTHRWLDRCVKSWTNPKQSLFGIIQGSTYDDLRKECAQEVIERDLPGIAIGGVSVGEGRN